MSVCVGILLLFLAVQARALNQRMYPLGELIKDSDCIALGRAVAVDVPKMRAALLLETPLKGEVPYRWVALNVAPGGWGHPPAMIRRLGPGLPLVFFCAKVKGRHVVLGYGNGTWFQISAPDGPEPDRLPWAFTHIEVFLRRTFAGSTDELTGILKDVLAGKREAPAPNPGNGAGMGPEVPNDYKPPAPLPPLPDFIQKAIAEPKQGGVTRKIAVRPLAAEEQTWVDAAAKQFKRPPEETAMLLSQARYVVRDAQRALEYERDHGSGGNRAWVRSAEEILDLKQRSDRLCWLDVRGVLMRAGELFTPVTDPVDLIQGLRTKFTWDELDPMLDDDKWGRKKLAEEIPKKLAARSPHPLAPGDKVRQVLLNPAFGAPGSGEAAMESAAWKPLPGASRDFPRRQYDWDGGAGGSQKPGAVPFSAPGSARNPISNAPPKPGLPLAAKAGDYSGASLWFAATGQGAHAFCDQGWLRVHQGESASFLVTAQVYTPDHTDEVGEPRSGWFYIKRPSRYIDAGIRVVDAETRTVSLTQAQALLLKVEPSLDRFDRVLLRMDVTTHREPGKRNTEGKNEVRVIAYADGIGEVARATADLNPARKGNSAALDASDEGVALAPAFGLRTAGEGYVSEFYLATSTVRQINDGALDLIQPEAPPIPPVPSAPQAVQPMPSPAAPAAIVVRKPAPSPGSRPAAATTVLLPTRPDRVPLDGPHAPRGRQALVIAIDSSSSMGPHFEQARAAALEQLAALKRGDRFALLNCHAQVERYSPDWAVATPDNVQKAADWLKGLKVTSGTNLSATVENALSYPNVNRVVLITDGGGPSQGITDLNQLFQLARDRNKAGARIDALLVTQAPPGNPASRLAQDGHGETKLVGK